MNQLLARPAAWQEATWHHGLERKSARELALMREAGKINALALAEMVKHTRPGVATKQLNAIAERVIRGHGAEPAFKNYPGPYPFPASITVSVNEQLVHGLPGPRVIREGDLVSLDCGVKYQGYYADAAVSVGVGKCSPLVRKILQVTEEALWVGIRLLRPGRRTGDVSAAMREFVEDRHGFRLVRNYTSHGIGRHVHEDPALTNDEKAGTGALLRPGLVMALEPMVLVSTRETRVLPDQWTVVAADGEVTAHFEHTVAITEGEPDVLTALPVEDLVKA
jgi:methionyl aminopeptidase